MEDMCVRMESIGAAWTSDLTRGHVAVSWSVWTSTLCAAHLLSEVADATLSLPVCLVHSRRFLERRHRASTPGGCQPQLPGHSSCECRQRCHRRLQAT